MSFYVVLSFVTVLNILMLVGCTRLHWRFRAAHRAPLLPIIDRRREQGRIVLAVAAKTILGAVFVFVVPAFFCMIHYIAQIRSEGDCVLTPIALVFGWACTQLGMGYFYSDCVLEENLEENKDARMPVEL